MFLELIQNMEKHERVENYVAARVYEKEEMIRAKMN